MTGIHLGAISPDDLIAAFGVTTVCQPARTSHILPEHDLRKLEGGRESKISILLDCTV